MAEVLEELNQIHTSKVAENVKQDSKQKNGKKKTAGKKATRAKGGRQIRRTKTKAVSGSEGRPAGSDKRSAAATGSET
jgi:hypothetical protein